MCSTQEGGKREEIDSVSNPVTVVSTMLATPSARCEKNVGSLHVFTLGGQTLA